MLMVDDRMESGKEEEDVLQQYYNEVAAELAQTTQQPVDKDIPRKASRFHVPVRCGKQLPRGWRKARDGNTGAYYFYCKALNRSQWELPTLNDSVNNLPLAPGWVEAFDPGSQREYYHHRERNISCWERPIDTAQLLGFPRCKQCNAFGVGVVRASGYCSRCAPAGSDDTELVTVENIPLKSSPAERAAAMQRMKQKQVQEGASHRNDSKRKQGKQLQHDELDPTDPSAWSSAPRGGWGVGLARARGQLPQQQKQQKRSKEK